MPTHPSQDEQAKPASVGRLLLLLPAFLVLVVLCLYFVQRPRFAVYQKTPIHGRAERIVSMGKGAPTVLLQRQSTPQILLGPQAFGQYLAVGDSVVKPAGTRDFYIYRTKADGTEVSAWRYAELTTGKHYTLSRYRMAK